MMFGLLRRLLGHSAVYTLSSLIARGATYLLIPIYARMLTTSEYGLLGTIYAVMNAASLCLMFGLYAAASRLYFDYAEGPERRQLYGSLWLVLVILPMLLLIAFDQAGPMIFGGWLTQVRYEPYVRLGLWSAYLSNFRLLPLTLFRNRERPGVVLALTASGTLLNVSLALLLVVGFRQGVTGILVAGLAANLVMAGVYSLALVGSVDFRPAPAKLWSAVLYSLPFWPHAIAGWVLNLSDRVLLERFVSLAQVGIYSLGYQIGQALVVVIEAGSLAWSPFFFRAETEQRQSPVVPGMATYFVAGMSGLCLVTALGARPALRLFTPPAYWAAETVAFWLALGFLSVGPYYIWSLAIVYSKRVSLVPVITAAAGLVNVGLNLWLMPRWGILAAAANTVIGYLVLAGLNGLVARRVYPLSHEYIRWSKAIGLAALLGVAGQWVRAENPWLEGVLRLGVIGAWAILLASVGFLSAPERRAVTGAVLSFGGIVRRAKVV